MSVSACGHDLEQIVISLCALVGLSESDVDASDLAGITVDGYVISAIGPVRGMLEPLAQAFFFDALESDNQVKFVRRGGSVAVTIPQVDLAAHQSGDSPAPLSITRREETELPVEVNVAYLARANNYQQGVQLSRRITTQSKMKAQYPLSIVMTDDQAQQTADSLLYAAWQERDMVEFSTGRKYSKYEPTDPMSVTVGDKTYRIRPHRKDEGGNGVIKWAGVIEDTSVYTQTSTGATMVEPVNTVTLPADTVLEMLDVPMLRESDDDPGFYFAACGAGSEWRGQQLYQSKDGTTYTALANALTVAAATIGYAVTALGNCARPGQFDEGNSVTVALLAGSLSSATRDQVMAGANVALLGNEVLQFRDATLVAANTYKLTGLLRGRLGTEAFTGTHASETSPATGVGRFILLDNDLRTITQGWGDVGLAYYYKAVTFGLTLAQTTAEAFTNTARRTKPLAPVNLVAGRDGSGNWLIRWVRQTRFPAPWRDGVDAPLGETAESYSIDVMNGATVVRTIAADEQSATYTAAQWASDFGSPTPASITINVYQLSAEYGRGYAATGTFT